MSLANLPVPIAAFLKATVERDSRALLACFAPDAVLTDEGKTMRGAEIEAWNARLYLGAQVKVHPIHLAERDDAMVLTVIVDGDYAAFGVTGPFQLDWTFTFTGERIADLRMVQLPRPDAPAPVQAYIEATNSFDLDRATAAFAEDALTNDQHREYRGRATIRDWLAREIVGDRVTMFVTETRRHGVSTVVTAHIDGDYDKSGLPDPLILTFYFTVEGEHIDQLIILPNKTTSAA